jgi:hypothetical protein
MQYRVKTELAGMNRDVNHMINPDIQSVSTNKIPTPNDDSASVKKLQEHSRNILKNHFTEPELGI